MNPLVLSLLAVVQLAPVGQEAAPETPIPAAERTYNGREGQLDIAAPRVGSPTISVDACLDEPEWDQAAILTGFTQYTPVEGTRASQESEVLVFYSADAIYFGFRVFDSEPDRVLAHLLERDRSQSDDWMRIMLDTFNDARQAYTFFVSPLGLQSDGMWLESLAPRGGPTGPKVDFNLDFIYESDGRVTEDGWVAEVRIPYLSLRFPEAEVQAWGLQVARGVMRNGYKSTWAPITVEAASVLAQSGRLSGLQGLEPKRLIEVNPVATGKIEGFQLESGFQREEPTPEFGIDGSVGITQNLVLDATINPDFSQVEADVDQIQVNERFALFVPERRSFFLEGIEVFRTSQNLVNTRQIVDPIGGAKLTGKVGPFQVGYLGAMDESPGEVAGQDRDALFNLVRARADIGEGSTFGALYTDRSINGGPGFNRVASADARLLFGGRYTLETQFTGSWTRTDLEEDPQVAPAFTFNFARSGLNFSYSARLNDLSEDFVTQTGFMPRRGDTDWGGAAGFSIYSDPGAALETWGVEVQANNFTRHDDFWEGGSPYEYEIQLMPSIAFRGSRRMGSVLRWGGHRFLPEFYSAHEVVDDQGNAQPYPLPPELKDMLGVAFLPNIRFSDQLNLTGAFIFRTIPIFSEGSRGWESRIAPNLRIQPSVQLRVEASYTYSRIERSIGSTHFSTAHIPRLRLQYQFSKALLARIVGQYDMETREALRHPVTGQAVLINGTLAEQRERGNFTGQALVSFEPSPGTIFFVGYSRVMTGPYGLPLDEKELRQDGLFMKLSYLFRL